MKNYRHILWDWNGTLLDDVWLSVEIINELLQNHHPRKLTEKRHRELFDFPVQRYYEKLGFNLSIEPYEILSDKYNIKYAERFHECQLHQEAHHVIKVLHQKGYPQSILSAAEQTLLNRMLKQFGLENHFESVSGLSNKLGISKENIGNELLEKINLPAHQVLLIGDTTHDYHVAKAMGIDCLLVPSGHQSYEKLQSSSAKVVDSIAVLLEI